MEGLEEIVQLNDIEKAVLKIITGKLELMIATNGYSLSMKKDERDNLVSILNKSQQNQVIIEEVEEKILLQGKQ